MQPALSLLSSLAFFSLPVLAELPDPKSSEALGWVMLILAGLLVIAKNASDLIRTWFFKSPPDHDRYASKSDLTALELEMDKDVLRVEHRLEEWATGIDTKLEKHIRDSNAGRQETERALGRIEGKIDAIKPKHN